MSSTLALGPKVESISVVRSAERSLFADSRCDRCGAQAFVKAMHPDMSTELLFCGHHGRKNLDALVNQGWTLNDQTPFINIEASMSANSV